MVSPPVTNGGFFYFYAASLANLHLNCRKVGEGVRREVHKAMIRTPARRQPPQTPNSFTAHSWFFRSRLGCFGMLLAMRRASFIVSTLEVSASARVFDNRRRRALALGTRIETLGRRRWPLSQRNRPLMSFTLKHGREHGGCVRHLRKAVQQ